MVVGVGGGVVVVALRTAPFTSVGVERRRGRGWRTTIRCVGALAAAEEDHYRTLGVTPAASRVEVQKAFRHLALQHHPDVLRGHHHHHHSDGEFQRISVAYQAVMGSMREAEERLEYWRRRYGLSDEELDRYRYYLNEDCCAGDDDDW